MRTKANLAAAEKLMVAKNEVWDKLNICCGWSSHKGSKKFGYSVEEKKSTHDRLLIQKINNLGYNINNKVPDKVREILESENYHSLNRVLQENGLGEGNY